MKIAIIGYGKMGKEIEKLALERGHSIGIIIDKDDLNKLSPENLENIDVAIEFTTPDSAYQNIIKCFNTNIPVVCGTTGWTNKLNDVIDICEKQGKTFFYAPNYSLGVNIFFKLNTFLASIINNYPAYDVCVEETHHTQKLDAPSGTAITIADGILKNMDRKSKWVKEKAEHKDDLVIKSFREGNVPGNHKVIYESSLDKIQIEHDAKNRQGLAFGAVLAAEHILGKTGYFTMNDLLKI